MNQLKTRVHEAIEAIESSVDLRPQIAVVLGSGLGGFAESLQNPQILSTAGIPHYPQSTVPGHAGRLIFGSIASTPVLALQGRVHYYEGYSLEQVTFPVHVMAGMGIKALVVTTSCGGLNPAFNAGDLMLIRDHINFTGHNPLRGAANQILGTRFVDMGQAYDPQWLEIAREAGRESGKSFREGVFVWVSGPNYETAAEVRMLHALGGDAVSMSTVPEVVAARQRHLRVLGISLITNPGTGLSEEKLSHKDVTRCAQQAGETLGDLLHLILPRIQARLQVSE